MKITRKINGELCTMTPLSDFIESNRLPTTFGVQALVDQPPAPAKLWGNPSVTSRLENKMKQAIPPSLNVKQLPELPDGITAVLRAELVRLSETHNLTIEEIDTAVLDLQDMLMPAVYRLVDLSYAFPGDPQQIRENFDIDSLLQTFLGNTSAVGAQTYRGSEVGAPAAWLIQILYDQFGPFGLRIEMETTDERVLIFDPSLRSPSADPLTAMARSLGQMITNRMSQNL